MKLARRLRLVAAAAFAVPAAFVLLAAPFGRLSAAPADAPAWKDLVTEKDLDGIAKATIGELKGKVMKSAGAFNGGAKKAVVAGAALAAVGNAGAAIGEGEAAKKAVALREAAAAFAAAAKSKKFPAAKTAFATLEKYGTGLPPAESGDAKPWKDVISLHLTMENVSRIDNDLKAALAKEADFKAAGKDLALRMKLAAILARITREEKTEADWQGWCDDMAKSSGELAAAANAKNFAAGTAAHDRLQKSCTKCHEVYHKGKD